jgi:hypothetical protein
MSTHNVQIKPHTVFVIGAGASKELLLPIGSELKTIISQALNFNCEYGGRTSGDQLIFEAIEKSLHSFPKKNKNELLDAAQRIKDGLIQSISIDNFIDIHQVNESVVFCGKLAIINNSGCRKK